MGTVIFLAALSVFFALWLVRVFIVHRIRMWLLDEAGKCWARCLPPTDRHKRRYRACMDAYNSVSADTMARQLHKWTRRQFFPHLD